MCVPVLGQRWLLCDEGIGLFGLFIRKMKVSNMILGMRRLALHKEKEEQLTWLMIRKAWKEGRRTMKGRSTIEGL